MMQELDKLEEMMEMGKTNKELAEIAKDLQGQLEIHRATALKYEGALELVLKILPDDAMKTMANMANNGEASDS